MKVARMIAVDGFLVDDTVVQTLGQIVDIYTKRASHDKQNIIDLTVSDGEIAQGIRLLPLTAEEQLALSNMLSPTFISNIIGT